ncbi:hypothetical protein AOQ84DRAFT_420121 [Glonium stellatum]|uniref:Uncharacterized protein n=1 Tax=Glonium stellatum TaxID=574774 RepID=A0A8E2JWK9_9PEZI|nr:hypothetical protein AOQ84DRAFT_420121 [Glonium stellatum]
MATLTIQLLWQGVCYIFRRYNSTAAQENGENTQHSEAPQQADMEPLVRVNVDCIFSVEEEEDYTSGPAKMIIANDGSKKCAALLLSFELSTKIQNALTGQRKLRGLELRIEQQRTEIFHNDQKAFGFVIRTRNQLARLKKKATGDSVEPTDEQKQHMQELQDRINEAEDRRSTLRIEDESLAEQLRLAVQNQRMLQHEVDVILDDVYVNCQLLEPQTTPLPSQQFEFLAIPEAYQHQSNADVGSSINIEPNFAQRGSTDERNPIVQQASFDLEKCRGNLARAQRDFNANRESYGRELQSYLAAHVNSPHIDLQAEFDLIHLQKGQKLTRQLLEAEQAYENVKVVARAVGVPHGYFQESNFGDHPDDGYKGSQEIGGATLIDRKRIESWLESSGQITQHDWSRKPEIDDWSVDSGKLFDSVSVIAQGSDRKRIDRWRDEIGHY